MESKQFDEAWLGQEEKCRTWQEEPKPRKLSTNVKQFITGSLAWARKNVPNLARRTQAKKAPMSQHISNIYLAQMVTVVKIIPQYFLYVSGSHNRRWKVTDLTNLGLGKKKCAEHGKKNPSQEN